MTNRPRIVSLDVFIGLPDKINIKKTQLCFLDAKIFFTLPDSGIEK